MTEQAAPRKGGIRMYKDTQGPEKLGVDEDGHDWFRCSAPGCRRCPVVKKLPDPAERCPGRRTRVR